MKNNKKRIIKSAVGGAVFTYGFVALYGSLTGDGIFGPWWFNLLIMLAGYHFIYEAFSEKRNKEINIIEKSLNTIDIYLISVTVPLNSYSVLSHPVPVMI